VKSTNNESPNSAENKGNTLTWSGKYRMRSALFRDRKRRGTGDRFTTQIQERLFTTLNPAQCIQRTLWKSEKISISGPATVSEPAAAAPR
jgi:hypothetical protein